MKIPATRCILIFAPIFGFLQMPNLWLSDHKAQRPSLGEAVAQTSAGHARSHKIAQAQDWEAFDQDDPLFGKTTYFQSQGTLPNSSLLIAFSRRPNSNDIHKGVSLIFDSGREFRCPYVNPAPPGVVPPREIYVSWRIDEEPVHTQRYDCGNSGRCSQLHYRWRVLSVDREGYINRYHKVPEPFPHRPLWPEGFYGLPSIQFVSMLRKARLLYIGVADQCDNVSVEFDLRGLDEVMSVALNSSKPGKSPSSPPSPKVARPPHLPTWNLPSARKPHPASVSSISAQDVFSKVSPSVYVINAKLTEEGTRGRQTFAQGSAVAISRNEAITNCHVVARSADIVLLNGSTKSAALVVSADMPTDRCLLLVPGADLTPVANLREYSNLRIGETVFTVGAPLGLDKTLGHGLISGLRQDKGLKLIQITAPISRGSSGGGLFDDRGNLIGITTFALRDSQSLNFAIAASEYWR